MKKLNTKGYLAYKTANFVSVILLAGALIFIWQLYSGSIKLPFLKPYIIRALNHDDADYQVDLDSVSLELVRSIQPLRIIAKNVSYQKENTISINAPKVSLSFSIKALMHGVIAPSSIEIEQPSIYIYSRYNIGDTKDNEEIKSKKLRYYIEQAEEFWDHFNSADDTYPESYINSIAINKAEVELLEIDLGKKWHFSDVNYQFDRGFSSVSTEINALMPFSDSASSLGLAAEYDYSGDAVGLKFYFSDLIPSELLKLLITDDKVAGLYNIRIPLHGNIATDIKLKDINQYKDNLLANTDKLIEKIDFDFAGEKGVAKFGDDDKYDYHLSGLLLKGSLSGNFEHITIKDAKLNLDGQEAELGLKVDGLKPYLLSSSPDNLKVKLTAKVKQLETSKLTDYWPRYFSDAAWSWCQESLYDGYLRNGDFSFNFGYDKKKKSFEFEGLSGEADIDGSTIFYLQGMPVISDTKGHAKFSTSSIYIDITQGKSDGVMLNGGFVDLYDLNKEDNFIKLDLKAVGSISDILKLIDHEPLKYPSSAGLNPDRIKGSSEVDLKLAFELRSDLEPDDVNFDIAAILHDVEINDIIDGHSIDAKNLDLILNNKGMNISGVANIEGLPIGLVWDEQFSDNKPYQRRYQLSFNFDQNFMTKTGIDISALKPPFINGSIPSKAIITVTNEGTMIVDAHGNLRETIIDYGFLGFAKSAGENGEIAANIKIKDGKLRDIPSFSLSKPDFKVMGSAAVNDKGQVNKVDISSIKGPHTNASALVEIGYEPKQNIKVTVSGSSYDLSPFFDSVGEESSESLPSSSTESKDDFWDNVPNSEINIAVDKLWTSPDIYTASFAGTSRILNKIGVDEMHLVGNFKPNLAKSPKAERPYLKLDYTPRGSKEYLLKVDSNDAGSALKFLRVYDYFKGGTLTVEAKRNANKVMIGHAKARNFNLTKTGVLVKLLTLASLTGIVDMLSGDGISFTHFDAPFEYDGSKLKLSEAKAFGSVLGISGSGSYDEDKKMFDFKGMIAPAYGLNSLIGKIPLVGKLLSGRDGTVFAVNYQITGPLSDPNISINPLSALSPNSVKDLWNDNFGEKD